jgi:hypothetical protein
MCTLLLLVGAVHASRQVSVYSSLQSPREHPLYERREIQPPEYSAFGPNGVGFMSLRGFPQDGRGNLIFNKSLDKYTGVLAPDNDVCSIIWPGISTIAAPNFPDLVAELKRRDLGMLVGGFVPGGRQQFDASNLLPFNQHLGAAKAMGPKYLGLGQSEQDIRYLWGYSRNADMGPMLPSAGGGLNSNRFDAYRSFREYASEIEELSGDDLFVLARGVFTHYYLQTGVYTIAGAEESGGPPAQLTYAFLRGAAKQYGTLVLSNVCSFTRWGHKIPGDPSPSHACTSGGDHGPTCGEHTLAHSPMHTRPTVSTSRSLHYFRL